MKTVFSRVRNTSENLFSLHQMEIFMVFTEKEYIIVKRQ